MMSQKRALALTQDVRMVIDAGISHRIITRNLDDLVPARVVVPANILAERFLLVAPLLLPGCAAGVLFLVGAFFPGCHHVECVGERLGDDDARVERQLAFAVV